MRSSLLASINLAVMFLGWVLLSGAIARAHWRKRGTLSVVFLIIFCGHLWLIPQAVSFFAFDSARLLYPLWFGNWIVLAAGVALLCLTLRGSSRDLSDAALMDGTGPFATYRHVIWPTVKAALGLLALLLVMATWADFAGLVGIEITGALRMEKFLRVLLASFLATLPIIAIFFFAQRAFLRRATSTGRKS